MECRLQRRANLKFCRDAGQRPRCLTRDEARRIAAAKSASCRTTAAASGLSDSQLLAVWTAAEGLPVQKRGVFLERVIARLQLCGSRFTDVDLDDAVRLALRGLIQNSAA